VSGFLDVLHGLYFRKSKQVKLAQSVDHISKHLGRLQKICENTEQATELLRNRISELDRRIEARPIDERLCELSNHIDGQFAKPQEIADTTVEDVLNKNISARAETLDMPNNGSNRYQHWFDGKEFSRDWTSNHFDIWSEIFELHGKEFKNGLEIGSFEGRSAIFFLGFFSQLRLCCVDPFKDTHEFGSGGNFPEPEFYGGTRFDKNLRSYEGRYEKIESESAQALARFVSEGRHFDFIYIDGSHYRDNVLIDALLSWKLLNVNGIIIFDDYDWCLDRASRYRPKDAIDYFVYSRLDELKILHKGFQFIIKKVTNPVPPIFPRFFDSSPSQSDD
jgi:Methyltransferase domain